MGDTATQAERGATTRPELALPRPLWSLRRMALIVGLPLLVVLAVFVFSLLDRRELSTTTVAGPIDRVVVQVARGDVELVPAQPGTTDVSVESISRWRFMRPTAEVVQAERERDVVRIDAGCPRVVLVVGVCAVDFLIEVPPGVQVFVRTDDGEVVAEGLDGWARFVTSGGGVSATGLRSDEMLVESHGGAVDLDFASAPSRVDVTSDGGAVSLTVPDAEPYDVRTAGSSGELDIGIEDVGDAERVLRVRGGDVTIRPT
ncbi:DUF4097 family beta strand repeat-containing protein [Actinomarinicola tropica]|uniref:DUF4097 family beta strand repeat protein n=1 Tax=Actinomarinicola tropica TaxID=2789776 RepID=A0A5Q2RDM4_9ACTN|nr:hypothetical protein [Actinomarinicola tropica]QGG93753.1 hypothetical protein GH723_00730 [Actinomarinicola tropica]